MANIVQKNYAYLNNKKLKRANVKMELSREEVREYIKCSRNPIYFAEKYVEIVDGDDGKGLIKLYKYQKKILKKMMKNRFIALLQCRQSGKTTVIWIFILHFIIFNDYKAIGILANKAELARKILARLKLGYENLPHFLQQGVVEWNKGTIELENGSRVLATATSSSSAVGDTFSMVYADEISRIPQNIWNEFYTSLYPTISQGKKSRFVMSSTPKGLNHWYKICEDARNGRNLFKLIEVIWSAVPGRGKRWKKEQIANMGEEEFSQEHENEFLGSTLSLISSTVLKKLVWLNPIYEHEHLKLYAEPVPGHTYVINVDPSKGKGLDYHAINITDITESPFIQVGTYHDNKLSKLLLPTIISQLGKQYNDAYVLIETNNGGDEVANILNYDLEYENLLMMNDDMGMNMNKATRNLGCSTMRDLIENEHYVINDIDTITELSGFIAKGGKYQADSGFHDDLVMTLVAFSWLSKQDIFKDLTNIDIRQQLFANRMKELEETMNPFPVIDNGMNQNVVEVDQDGTVWEEIGDDDLGFYM